MTNVLARLIIVLESTSEVMKMDAIKDVITVDEQEEIKEFVSILLLLPKEDRAVLLSNANAFRVRRDLEKAVSGDEGR
ncbi:MAG: hypothetical protein [Bacteriophage sp.]|nr:MAG: hypothetical protein [Bacteriophage sp.]